ncbi:DUF3626 domain-containing protein [Shewanella sedimentimangrovi]|uniref:DUF3626 domain-containing protein n=1 Tax=Shewanella sedimentimangrovi TaxID=2814293 RepID=A0ABX7R2B5_9GAMM|nr:DUF3626 domain-containing protein [Shewanella sedimentimangrovi]QSX37966.1 DUF3626 domain-containing protein [Shewanella sedimentimangrovi]
MANVKPSVTANLKPSVTANQKSSPLNTTATYPAIDSIRRYALEQRESAQALIRNVLQMSDISPQRFNAAMDALQSHGRIALHFHPDRLDCRGLMVAEGLFNDGLYRNQFETHVSNGLLSPEIGGPRDHWERAFFGSLCNDKAARPKYGALDLGLFVDGPSPRFGSCYFLCSEAVLQRSSFCYLDSYRTPREKGTRDCFDMLLAALLSESFERGYALGQSGLPPTQLIAHLLDSLPGSMNHRLELPLGGNLDHYIEAQVHGPLSLATDVDCLVADPSFNGTEVGQLLAALCGRYGVQLLWHRGRELLTDRVPRDFRGATMPELARQVAIDGRVSAYAIGKAARAARASDGRKRLEELKWLWHVLVRFGTPPSTPVQTTAPT